MELKKHASKIYMGVCTAACLFSVFGVMTFAARLTALENSPESESFDMKEALDTVDAVVDYVSGGGEAEDLLSSIEDETMQAFVRQEYAQTAVIFLMADELDAMQTQLDENLSSIDTRLAEMDMWMTNVGLWQENTIELLPQLVYYVFQLRNTMNMSGLTCAEYTLGETPGFCY